MSGHHLIPRHVRLRGAPLARPEQKAAISAGPRVVAGQTPLSALALPAESFWLDGNPAYATPEDGTVRGMAAYGAVSLAYICMRYRATKLTEARLWIADETDDGESWLEGGHALEGLLEQPNPDMSHGEFWELVSLYLDIDGSCLLVKNRDRAGRVGSLYPFPGTQFTVESTATRLYGRFRVTQLNGELSDWLAPEDVIYLREADPGNLWGAVSPTDAALGDLNIAAKQRATVRALFRNAMLPGSITTVPGNLSDEQFERWRTQFAPQYQGAANAGKNVLVEGAATWAQVKVSLKEFDYGPLADRIEASVCAAYGLHPVMVGLYAASAMSGGMADSIGPATDQFYDRVLFPRWERIGEKLTQGLLRGDDGTDADNLRRYVRWNTENVRALQEDVGEKVTTAAAAKDFWTKNEQRAFTGKAPTGDPADDVLTKPSPALAPPGDDDDSNPNDAAPPKGAAGRSGGTQRKATGTAGTTDADLAWLLFDAVATAQEFPLELAALELLSADRDAIVRLVTDGAKATRGATSRKSWNCRICGTVNERDGWEVMCWKCGDRDIPPDVAPTSRKETARPLTPEEIEAIEAAAAAYLADRSALAWRQRMTPALRLVADGAVQRVAASVGIAWDVLQEGLLEVVEARAAWLVTQVSDTTRDGIRRALRDGLAAGESIPDIARRIADATTFSRERATLIARTESTAVTNLTQREQLSAYATRTGRTVTKTWLTARDARVRDEHRALEGQTRPITKAFSNGEMQPGAPRCRCTLTYTVQEAAA